MGQDVQSTAIVDAWCQDALVAEARGRIDRDIVSAYESISKSLTRILTRRHDKINITYESIRTLRTRRNSLSKICALPPEILVTIFSHCSADWVPFSHVCKHWRDTLVYTPRFWSSFSINTSSLSPWSRVKLERSGASPLDLKVAIRDGASLESQPTRELLQDTFRQSPWMRTLQLTFVADVIPFLVENLTAPALILESLMLARCDNADESDYLPDLFSDQTPALRRLLLEKCSPPMNSPIFTQLHWLEFKFVPPSLIPDAERLLAALRHTPALRELRIVESLPRETTITSLYFSDQPGSDVVSLPNLRRIRMLGSLDAYAGLLTLLDFPTTTRLRLDLGLRSPLDPALWNGVPFLPQKVFQDRQSSFDSAQTLELTISSHHCVYKLYDTQDEPDSRAAPRTIANARHKPTHHLDIRFISDSIRLIPRSCMFLPFIPASRLVVRMDQRAAVGLLPFRDLFRGCHQVRSFLLEGYGDFSTAIGALNPRNTASMVMPQLEELHIRWYDGKAGYAQSTPEDLMATLRERVDATGAPLTKLVLEGHYVLFTMFKPVVEMLKGVVSEAYILSGGEVVKEDEWYHFEDPDSSSDLD